ncbi:glycosyltransferase family 4 protein, partial [Candidatus Parcubacteria bacterium]|nr:glycosyltransferase family 4 protein [Candidatus Parcubacteria bacterium]
PIKILTFHSNLERSKTLERFPFLISLFNKIVEWRIDGLICVSKHLLKFFENYKGPKVVIPNGIDLKKFQISFQKPKVFSNDKINILFVGRIEERKGLIYLLKAFAILQKKYKNIRLIIVGDGSEEMKCKEYVKKNQLKEVYFEGKKTEKEIPIYYLSCDIFVAPSIYGESFGIVLLEAMAAKKPIVAFDIPGFSEVVEDKKESFLVEAKNVQKLAEKIGILIENENLRKEMGEMGWKKVQQYSWDKIGERILNFYQEILKLKKPNQKF